MARSHCSPRISEVDTSGYGYRQLINDPDPGVAEIGLALGSHLRSGIVLAMIDDPDPGQAALGEQLAVYLPAETLTAMATGGNPRHARIAGKAVARGLTRG